MESIGILYTGSFCGWGVDSGFACFFFRTYIVSYILFTTVGTTWCVHVRNSLGKFIATSHDAADGSEIHPTTWDCAKTW